MTSHYELINVQNHDDGVSVITINRPDVYNALNRQSKMELIDALEKAALEESIKAVVLTANGKAFCSGQDLNDRANQDEDAPKKDLGETLKTEWNPLVEAIRNCPKIVVAAINGVTAGAGISVAMACDLVIAPEKTRFVSGFTKLGLVPDAGSTHTFTNALGPKKAMEFFLFNQPLMSEELQCAGLINAIDSNPIELAQKWCGQIANMAPLSIAHLKKNIQKASHMSFADSMLNETNSQCYLGQTEDFNEGVLSFFEKRTPVFKGVQLFLTMDFF